MWDLRSYFKRHLVTTSQSGTSLRAAAMAVRPSSSASSMGLTRRKLTFHRWIWWRYGGYATHIRG